MSKSRILLELSALKEARVISRLKVETESEGANWEQIGYLQHISNLSNIPLGIKIGGCEAKTDMVKARWLGIADITAPMIETRFAAFKFRQAMNSVFSSASDVKSRILIESISGFENGNSIIEEAIPWAYGLNIGRSDLALSMSHGEIKDIPQDSEVISDIVFQLIRLGKDRGLEVTVGGKLTEESIRILGAHDSEYRPDYVETRRFVLNWNEVSATPTILNRVLNLEKLLAQEALSTFTWESIKASEYVAELDKRLTPATPRAEIL